MLATQTTINVSAETAITKIAPEKLHAHPANPPSRVEANAILGLMQLIDQFGQREPCRVRELSNPIGHYQILSGHRRHAACKMIGREVVCQVVECDDGEALREVMLGNADRDDLNPIQRAELMLTMIDAGIDRAEAGKMFGFGSDSGIKNTLRLLALPKSIRSLVESGQLPARAARVLVPYAEATMILDAFAKDVIEQTSRADELIKDGVFKLRDIQYRPMDGKTKYNAGYEFKSASRKFDVATLTAKQLRDLGVVVLPIGPKGESLEIAQNVKLFDSLNAIHLEKSSGYGDQRKAKTKTQAADNSKLTPAAIAAEDKRKSKEADERLAKRLPIWRRRFMRCLLATQTPPGHVAIPTSLPWLLSKVDRGIGPWIESACGSLGAIAPKSSKINALELSIGCITGKENHITDRLWRILLWPQVLDWQAGPIAKKFDECLSVDEPPQKMIGYMESTDLDQPLSLMVGLSDASITGAWRDSATAGTPESMLFREFLDLHTTDQLAKQAKAWAVEFFAGDKKSKLVDLITAKHTVKEPLGIPICLAKENKR